jgi:hypothetical protein
MDYGSRSGYAPCWPFRVRFDGFEWTSDMGPVAEWIFENVASLFWDGTIRLDR